jgi:hypothetical protein
VRPACDLEGLEALVAEALPAERASELQTHARTCASCTRELQWLRTERRLMSERKVAEPGLPPDLWRGVERRIAAAGGAGHPARPGFFARWRPFARLAFPVLTGAAALATAVVLHLRNPESPPPATSDGDLGALATGPATVSATGVMEVLDAALAEYQQAAALLEKDLKQSRRRLPSLEAEALERRIEPARRQLGDPPTGADAESRLRALDGYADYVRSLQAVVLAVDGGGR